VAGTNDLKESTFLHVGNQCKFRAEYPG